jgi:hypothetical protein
MSVQESKKGLSINLKKSMTTQKGAFPLESPFLISGAHGRI